MELKSSFKLSLIFLLVSAPTSLAFAYADSPCTFCGFTAGLGVGATTFMTNITSNTDVASDGIFLDTTLGTAPGNLYNNYAAGNVYKYGPMGALFVGYGLVFDNHTYLGAELGVNFLGANETSLRDNPTVTSTSTIFSFGTQTGFMTYNAALMTKTKVTRDSLEPFLDVKAGMLITPTALVYLRGGINYNSLKIKSHSSFNVTGLATENIRSGEELATGTATTAFNFNNSHTESVIGFRAGVGGEVMVTPEIGVGADYIYSFYKNINTSASGVGTDVTCNLSNNGNIPATCTVIPATVANSAKAKLSDQQVMAQFIYHFG